MVEFGIGERRHYIYVSNVNFESHADDVYRKQKKMMMRVCCERKKKVCALSKQCVFSSSKPDTHTHSARI